MYSIRRYGGVGISARWWESDAGSRAGVGAGAEREDGDVTPPAHRRLAKSFSVAAPKPKPNNTEKSKICGIIVDGRLVTLLTPLCDSTKVFRNEERPASRLNVCTTLLTGTARSIGVRMTSPTDACFSLSMKTT